MPMLRAAGATDITRHYAAAYRARHTGPHTSLTLLPPLLCHDMLCADARMPRRRAC